MRSYKRSRRNRSARRGRSGGADDMNINVPNEAQPMNINVPNEAQPMNIYDDDNMPPLLHLSMQHQTHLLLLSLSIK